MPTINFNILSVKELVSSINIEHKEDPRHTQNVQGSRTTYACVGETRESEILFPLNYIFKL